jgi:hypothetical protein
MKTETSLFALKRYLDNKHFARALIRVAYKLLGSLELGQTPSEDRIMSYNSKQRFKLARAFHH